MSASININSAALQTVRTAIQARFPALWMETPEERRALSELGELCESIGHEMFVWSLASGVRRRLTTAESLKAKGQQFETAVDRAGPDEALDFIVEYTGKDGAEPAALLVLCELDELLSEDVALRRKFREVADDVRSRRGRHLLVLTPRSGNVPKSIERTVTLVDLPVPSREQHAARVTRIVAQYKAASNDKVQLVNIGDDGIERLVNAATGLTRDGLDRALSVAMTEHGVLDERAIGLVAEQKKQLVDGTGFLQYEEPQANLGDVGGQDLLKKWLMQRMKAFGPEARKYGLTEPKGVLTVGPPGTGKSLGAKAASSAWGRPLIRLDVGALFGGLVGESESNTRKAIGLIEAMAPCVLWIDEIEKGLSGMGSSGSTDGGTTARVFQSLLTWLNEKKSAVFVYATANDPTKLPPELLRKGRLDEIFAITLPSHPERVEVLGIHIAKRKRDPKAFDLSGLAEATRGFSGAEIEQVVLDAMFHAFYEDREFNSADILDAIQATQPMSRTMRERITEMQAWAETRARPASSLSSVETAPAKKDAPSSSVLDIIA